MFTKRSLKGVLFEIKYLETLKKYWLIFLTIWFLFTLLWWLFKYINPPIPTIVEAKEIKKEFIYSKEARIKDLQAIKENRERYLEKQRKVLHLWFDKNDERQKWINYAYKISWYNKDFILTLTAENYRWTITRPSNIVWANWYRDYWICQVNAGYHPEILRGQWYKYPNDKYFAEWFLDTYKQIDYCWKLYKWWTKFYWYNVRYRIKDSIKFYN